MTFKEYLELKHSEHYMGTDDDMPDRFEAWVIDLDFDELVKHATNWNTIEITRLIEIVESWT